MGTKKTTKKTETKNKPSEDDPKDLVTPPTADSPEDKGIPPVDPDTTTEANLQQQGQRNDPPVEEDPSAENDPNSDTPSPKKDPHRVRYQFPSAVECPRCRCVDTVRTGQNGEIQYRKCTHPVCRHPFQIVGKKIGGKKKDKE